jgi:hypothetical protein
MDTRREPGHEGDAHDHGRGGDEDDDAEDDAVVLSAPGQGDR